MSENREIHWNKKSHYRALGLLLGLLLGMAMDSLPIGFVLGLSFGAALDKRYA
jgi:hypothetical protein